METINCDVVEPWHQKLHDVQGWAKEWTLGCVIPASWPPLAAGGASFSQPKAHSLAHPCTFYNGTLYSAIHYVNE